MNEKEMNNMTQEIKKEIIKEIEKLVSYSENSYDNQIAVQIQLLSLLSMIREANKTNI